ncbi:unnamed protein product [Notodromas monacha]|uniref:FCH domain-containing protein n=1 Tax=Notodromas monacha TaxID=399045 RepID=A0A7R9GGJ1_9CRUS|nr:unnamed protein product [Notodromas monacha]CAG0921768.1 unnamed protein product [Notodromas monacha]
MRGIATISATSEKFAIPDQYESIATHTNKGVEFLERLGHFVRDRSNVEIEYASKLRNVDPASN